MQGLQDPDEHAVTAEAVKTFLSDPDQGPRLQEKLISYSEGVASYIEEFWYESYLGQTESVSTPPCLTSSSSPPGGPTSSRD